MFFPWGEGQSLTPLQSGTIIASQLHVAGSFLKRKLGKINGCSKILVYLYDFMWSQGSSVSIASDYGLDDREIGFDPRQG
jgi:hypothetical protein